MSKFLFTIGHSNRTLQEFTDLLAYFGISAVCDVRSNPYSSKNPQFNREYLKEALKHNNKFYISLGNELGGRPDSPHCYTNGRADYKVISTMPYFRHGLERLRSGIDKNYSLVLMCSERDPISCHRTILICKHLRSDNFPILHIIDKDTVEHHSELEQRLVNELKIRPNFFYNNDSMSLIERAYEAQASRIAYTNEPELTRENESKH